MKEQRAKAHSSKVFSGLLSGAMIAAGMTLGIAGPALAVPPNCLGLSVNTPGTPTPCVAPGTLGSGAYVSLSVVVEGASGGGGYNGDYSTGGSGALVTATISVPAGSTLDLYVGDGGLATDSGEDNYEGAGGGGSSAVTLASGMLLLEAGGGGGGTNIEDWDGGNSSTSSGAGEAGVNSGVCGGRGGNADGLGSGGAAGSSSGSSGGIPCAGDGPSSPGYAGGSASAGDGGDGGSSTGALVGSGGSGYHKGGDGGAAAGSGLDWVYGGSGGGGGFGGGGGGPSAVVDSDEGATGTGGGGGSYLSPGYSTGTFDMADNGNYEDDGDPGEITFGATSEGSVLTRQAEPTDVTTSSAVLHSAVDPGPNFNGSPSIRYSTSASMASGIAFVTVSPTSVVAGAGDTNVTGTIASGLQACTTYYYQVLSANSDDPPATTFGAIESFTTPGCSTKLPLTVKAKSADKKLARSGKSVVVKSAATTGSGKVQTKVKCAPKSGPRGDLRFCTYKVGAKGKVTVRTYGYPRVKITVIQQAVPKKNSEATPSAKWKRTWSVK